MYFSHLNTATVHTLNSTQNLLCTSLHTTKKDRAPVSQRPGIYTVPKEDNKSQPIRNINLIPL